MQRILIIVIVVALVLAFMVTYVVRFNEAAVVTLFGRADENSVIREPGLKFKLPYPFQRVVTYDTRVRYIEAARETQQTADKSQLLVSSFVTWKVSDPLKFFRRFGGGTDTGARNHYERAEELLRAKLRNAMGAVSQFRTDELLNPSGEITKIAALEAAMLGALKGEGDASLSDLGIEPVRVGIAGIGLPADTTRAVFEHMRASRSSIANQAKDRGVSEANTMRSVAEADAAKITAFASALAESIKSQGDNEAAQYIAQMKEDPQLAVFIQQMSFMKEAFGSTRTTLVLPTSLPGFEFFSPDAVNKLKTGRPPETPSSRITTPKAQSEPPANAQTGPTTAVKEGSQ